MPNNSVESWVREFLPDYPITHNADGSIQIPHRPDGEGKEVNIKENRNGTGVLIKLFNGLNLDEFLRKNSLIKSQLFYKDYQIQRALELYSNPPRKETTPKKAKEKQGERTDIKQISAKSEPIETRKEIAKVVSDEIKNNIQLRLIEPKYDNRYLFKNEKDVELYKPDPAELKEISSKLGKLITLEGLIKADATICKKPYSIAFKVNDYKEIRINNNKEKTLYFEGRTDFLTAASLGLDAKYNLVGIFNKSALLKGVELLNSKEHLFIIDADVSPDKIKFNDELVSKEFKYSTSIKTLKLNDIDKDCKDFSDYIYNNITSVKDFEGIFHHARVRKAPSYITLDAASIGEIEPTIKFNGQTIGVKGALTHIFGVAGVGKSSVIESIVANLLNPDAPAERFYGIELEENIKRIIQIDTERELPRYWNSIKKAFKKAEIPPSSIYNKDGKYFEALKFKNTENMLDCIGMIEEIIFSKNPDLIIIDIISDFLNNILDAEQGTLLVDKLKELAENHKISFIVVSHANESDSQRTSDTATNHSRGHLGAQLQRKAIATLKLTRTKEDKNVTQISTTKANIGAWTETYFTYDDNLEMHLTCEKPTKTSNLELSQRDYFNKVLSKEPAMTYSELVEKTSKVAKKGKSTIKGWIADARKKDILIYENGIYYFNHKNI